MKGWVYVISNKAMPGLVKVGHSTKDPELRAKEFDRRATGSPHPYLIEYWMLTEDSYQIEQKTHQLLSSKREAKEWFRCTNEEVVIAIKQAAGQHAIIENYTRAERDKAEALHQQKIKEQEARLAQEKAEKDIEDRLCNEESLIRQKYQRYFETRFRPHPFWNYWLGCGVLILVVLAIFFPKASDEPTIILFSIIGGGFAGLFLRDYFEKKQKQSTTYRALEKQRDEELAALRGRVVLHPIDKTTIKKTQNSSNTIAIQAKILQNTDDYEVYFDNGCAHAKNGNYNQAIEAYNKTLELKPDEAAAYYGRGFAYANLGQYKRAIEDFNEAIRLWPDYAEAYYNRGKAYAKLGQYQHAIEDYYRLKADTAVDYKSELACDKFRQHQRTIDDWNEAIRLKPENTEAYFNRGNAYNNLGQYQYAIEDYNEAIRLQPNYVEAYNSRSNAFNKIGQHQRAIEDCNEAICQQPDGAAAYYNRGFAYAKLGQYQRAIEDWNEFIRLKPDYV